MDGTNGEDLAVGCLLSLRTTLGEEVEGQIITFDRNQKSESTAHQTKLPLWGFSESNPPQLTLILFGLSLLAILKRRTHTIPHTHHQCCFCSCSALGIPKSTENHIEMLQKFALAFKTKTIEFFAEEEEEEDDDDVALIRAVQDLLDPTPEVIITDQRGVKTTVFWLRSHRTLELGSGLIY